MGFYKNTTSRVPPCQSKLFDQLYPSQQNYYCLIIRYYHFFFLFLYLFLFSYLRFYNAPKKRVKTHLPEVSKQYCRVGKEFLVIMLLLFFFPWSHWLNGAVQWDLFELSISCVSVGPFLRRNICHRFSIINQESLNSR